MPTFQSIGIHPDLRTRLVTVPKVTGATAAKPQLVETPQALLSRTPAALRILDKDYDDAGDQNYVTRPIPLQQVRKLRQEVASALIAHSRNGKRLKRIRDSVSSQRSSLSGEDTQQWTIPGTLSALELCRYEASSKRPGRQLSALQTGCSSLDQLVALPAEHCSVSTKLEGSSSSALPAGIPLGYVTQIAGPPASGKTQLALQLAATNSVRMWYLCSHGSLRCAAERLAQLSCGTQQPVLDRTVMTTVTDEYQVLARLAQFEDFLLQRQQDDDPRTGSDDPSSILLVLDSCSGCLASADSDDAVLLRVAATIKRLTRQYGVAAVLINGSVSNRNRKEDSVFRPNKPALGRQWWKASADIHLWFEAAPSASTTGSPPIRATLERHPAKCCAVAGDNGKNALPAVMFRITAQGIQSHP
jgi:hypothetical protein